MSRQHAVSCYVDTVHVVSFVFVVHSKRGVKDGFISSSGSRSTRGMATE